MDVFYVRGSRELTGSTAEPAGAGGFNKKVRCPTLFQNSRGFFLHRNPSHGRQVLECGDGVRAVTALDSGGREPKRNSNRRKQSQQRQRQSVDFLLALDFPGRMSPLRDAV